MLQLLPSSEAAAEAEARLPERLLPSAADLCGSEVLRSLTAHGSTFGLLAATYVAGRGVLTKLGLFALKKLMPSSSL